MTNVKHTPGPWQITRYKNLPHAIAAADECIGAVPIATMVIANDHEANARLIAAAPELLAALKSLQLQALQSELNTPAHEWGREALEMARAAIAKAEGR